MRFGLAGVALAAVVSACALAGGAQRAEAAVIGFNVSGNGLASATYKTDDPKGKPFQLSGLGTGEAGGNFFAGISVEGQQIDIRGQSLSASSDNNNGAASFSSSFDRKSTSFYGFSLFNNTANYLTDYTQGRVDLTDLKTVAYQGVFGTDFLIISGTAKFSTETNYVDSGFDFNDQPYSYTYNTTATLTSYSIGGVIMTDVAYVPLPAAAPLFGAAILLLGMLGFTRRNRATATAQ